MPSRKTYFLAVVNANQEKSLRRTKEVADGVVLNAMVTGARFQTKLLVERVLPFWLIHDLALFFYNTVARHFFL